MTLQHSPIVANRAVAEKINVITFHSPSIAASILPGQFLNVRVAEAHDPLLRRAFSIYRTDGEKCEILYQVVGKGTELLSRRRPGETLDLLGPLGTPFRLDDPDVQTALLVAGGLGVAPLPITTRHLERGGKDVVTFLGGRTRSLLVRDHLADLRIATDDGSEGFHGTVVDLLRSVLDTGTFPRPKIFACGPTPMLRALRELALARRIPCEASLEGPMACGIGICQGCPVELVGEEKRYALMCKEGPVFDISTIRL